MALTLRGNGQVSSDNYGIDSDGSITATGITATGITSTGNVGIGTTSPETRLDVRSATATYLTVGNTTDNTSGLDTGIIFKQIGNIGNPATIQVIGNLSPTSGSAYTAGFKFKTGDWNGSAFSSVDAMTIAASGYVTTPKQPFVRLSLASHVDGGTTVSYPGTHINNFDVRDQVGTSWNNTTGYWTCPIAGKYMVSVFGIKHPSSGAMHLDLYSNGTVFGELRWRAEAPADYIQFGGTAVVELSVNDTLHWKQFGSSGIHSANGAFTIMYVG